MTLAFFRNYPCSPEEGTLLLQGSRSVTSSRLVSLGGCRCERVSEGEAGCY